MAKLITQKLHTECVRRSRKCREGQLDPGGDASQGDLQLSLSIVLFWAVCVAAAPYMAVAQDKHAILIKLAMSPDSKTLAATSGTWERDESQESEISLWNAASRTVRSKLAVPGRVWDIAYSPDGKLIAAGYERGQDNQLSGHVKLFDASTGDEHMSLDVGVRFGSLAFLAVPRLLAVTARNDAGEWALDLWDLGTRKIVRSLNVSDRLALALPTQPTIVATTDEVGKLELLDVPTGKSIAITEAPRGTIVYRLVYCPILGMLAQGTMRIEPFRR
jgi:WD40 repeat protein